MTRFWKSIRWRMQLWHGLLLVLVLTGFGFTAWRLQMGGQLRAIDRELDHRISVLASVLRLRNAPPPPDKPPALPLVARPLNPRMPPASPPPRQPAASETLSTSPPELPLSPEDLSLFVGMSNQAYYYVVWRHDGQELSRSDSAPASVPRPAPSDAPNASRFRETLRESFHFTPRGECILVGRNVSAELADMRRLAWWLTGAGALVLLVGLAGGWWGATRNIRPIQEISEAAARIAAGDLAQRIRTTDTDSELGELTRVLNHTFARLEAAFARQAQFTADAAHELRTPITILLTQSQSALARARSPEEYREALAACQRAAQRMRQLVESLLVLARLDSGNAAAPRRRCALDQIAREVIEQLNPLIAQRKVTLRANLSPAPCLGDPQQLSQVITNLVVNAIQYNREGGHVRVETKGDQEHVLLRVNDTGVGIAAEDLPHIFDRFYRADKSRARAEGRTGLGLAITQAIVEAHGGKIEVASHVGEGTTITVYLPRATATSTVSHPQRGLCAG